MSYVYVIECASMYKIGKADNVEERFKQLQTGNPFPMKIIKVYQTYLAHDLETYIHRRLKEYRQKGEWFTLFGIEQVDSIVDEFNNSLETQMLLEEIKADEEKNKRILKMREQIKEILGMNVSVPKKKHLMGQNGLIMVAYDSRNLLESYGIDFEKFKRIKIT